MNNAVASGLGQERTKGFDAECARFPAGRSQPSGEPRTPRFLNGGLSAQWSSQADCAHALLHGAGSIREHLAVAAWLAMEAEAWSIRRVVVDVRAVVPLREQWERQVAIDAVSMAFAGLAKVAFVGGLIGTEEHAEVCSIGGALRSFDNEQAALSWVRGE